MNPQQDRIYVKLDFISKTKGIRAKKKDIKDSLWLIDTLRGKITSLENQLRLDNKRTMEYCNLFSKLEHVKNVEISINDIYNNGIEGFTGVMMDRQLISRKEIITIQLAKINEN